MSCVPPSCADDRVADREFDVSQDCDLTPQRALEVILRNCGMGDDAAAAVWQLMWQQGSVAALLAFTTSELRGVGLTNEAIATLRAMRSLFTGRSRWNTEDRPVLANRQATTALLTAALEWQRLHRFKILFLSSNKMLLASETVDAGDASGASLYAREIISVALAKDAAYIYVVKEQPGDDLILHENDRKQITVLRDAGKYFNILVSEVIVCSNGKLAYISCL